MRRAHFLHAARPRAPGHTCFDGDALPYPPALNRGAACHPISPPMTLSVTADLAAPPCDFVCNSGIRSPPM
eukprot:scaffold57506_cov62-Phaeocystis_antarctica.AAC.1